MSHKTFTGEFLNKRIIFKNSFVEVMLNKFNLDLCASHKYT